MEVTALQQLINNLREECKAFSSDNELYFNTLLELEKQQIMDAWVQGYTEGYNDTHTIAEDYYNDHYGKAN